MNVINTIANGLRDELLSSNELNQRKEATECCTIGKVECVAVAIVVATAAIFSILSGTFAGVVLGMVTGGIAFTLTHDAYCLFDNFQQILDNAMTEVFVRLSKDALKAQLSIGMFVARPIVDHWLDSILVERS